MSQVWSREEVEAAVADYRRMLIQELSGQKYSKTEHRRALQKLLNDRSEGSIERKHQNISAILIAMNCPSIAGYKRLGNYQALLHEVVVEQIVDDPLFDQAALHAATQPAVAPEGIDFGYWLDDPPKPCKVSDPIAAKAPSFLPVQRDYVAREARNRALGKAGEELVLAYERDRLERLGQEALAGKVEHIASTRGDGAGYDILSYEESGRERFIEVKTTAFPKATPFYVSRNEVDFSERTKRQFHLYRLFEFRARPRMFMLRGNMRERLKLDAVSYRATV
ncbi:DUF3883 domain-containing protein [Oleiagrimonas sp.]|jgi:hypothetical protein|uniref:DUF3883 domain-containing protein n=1 Tax=Oleiagrimonas sp. TaxID=2010330 RepID=UPI002626D515|nr:DUF3883 domain-containing protein [Oleiagrimonas sp.]MDA3913861.1 DUF3883 domain-containing protein [Oleiagrimonas sp.]